MSTSKWRLVEDKESSKFYKECSELHQHSTTLVTVLRCVLLKLHESQANKLSSGVHSKDDDVELQDLEVAVELMQVAVPSFLDLASRRLPVEMNTQEKTRRTAPQPDYDVTEVSTPARRTEVWSVVCGSKVGHWRETVWQDRITLLYLCHQVVTDILRCCNNIAEQNHNHRTLENVFRLSNLYNDALALGSKDNQSVSTWCKNTCPILLHPLRKLSITKILQVLAQFRAEGCCRSLANNLLENYFLTQTMDHALISTEDPSSLEHSDNSSLVVYKALVRHMTPPNATALPPVNKVTPEGNKLAILPGLDVSGIDRLVAQEERHVATLLGVTARSTPHFLGRSGVKTSRNSGKQKASRQVKDKVVQFYQQVLWGEVGSFMEHVVLWWGSLPMGTMPQVYCRELRNWLHNITVNGRTC